MRKLQMLEELLGELDNDLKELDNELEQTLKTINYWHNKIVITLNNQRKE